MIKEFFAKLTSWNSNQEKSWLKSKSLQDNVQAQIEKNKIEHELAEERKRMHQASMAEQTKHEREIKSSQESQEQGL